MIAYCHFRGKGERVLILDEQIIYHIGKGIAEEIIIKM